jgi:hypothetical protein
MRIDEADHRHAQGQSPPLFSIRDPAPSDEPAEEPVQLTRKAAKKKSKLSAGSTRNPLEIDPRGMASPAGPGISFL